MVAIFAEQIHISHVLISQWHRTTAFKNKDTLTGLGELTSKGASSGAAADHDDVVMGVVDDHDEPPIATRRSVGKG